MRRAVRWLVIGGVCVTAALLVVAARVVVSVLTSEPDAVFGDRVDAFGDPLPAGAVARLGTVRLRSASSANLLFLDGGKLVVSAGMREEIVAWDTTTGARVWTLPGHRRRVYREPSHYRFRDLRRLVVRGEPSSWWDELRFLDASADGRTLVSSGWTISAWDVATRLEVGRARPPVGWFWRTAVADDRSIAYTCHPGLHVLDVVGGRELSFEPQESAQTENLFACSARAFATRSEDGTVVVRDRNTRAELGRVRTGDGSIRACALDDDGSRVWVGDLKGPIVCWSVASGERVGTWTQAGLNVTAIAVSGDGRWLATNVIEDRVRKVALWEGSELRSTWSRFGDAMAFSPDGSLLAVRDWPTIRLFETATCKERALADAHTLPVHALALSADGTLAASSSLDGTLRVWDTATSRVVLSVPVEASAIAFTRDGRALVAATFDGAIVAWDVATGAERHRRAPTREFDSIVLAQDGTGALVRGPQGSLEVLGLAEDGEVISSRTLAPPPDRGPLADAMAVSSDGTHAGIAFHRLVWVSGRDGHGDSLPNEGRGVHALRLSPDGAYAAIVSGTKVRVFDVVARATVSSFDVQPDGPSNSAGTDHAVVRFSHDGALLATGDTAGVVRLRRTDTWEEIATFRGHGEAITALAFSADGATLASGSVDTTVLVWRVPR